MPYGFGKLNMKLEEVKKNLNKLIVYKGEPNIYQLKACILRRGEKGYFYQAELLDTIHGHSIIICKLEDIEVMD